MKNIVKKIVLIILVSLVGLFLMSLLVNRQAKKWQEFSPSISVPDLELPKTQSQEIVLKEFISPDGKLKLKYPSDWTEVNTTTFEGTLSEEAKKVFNPLFLAQKMKIENLQQIYNKYTIVLADPPWKMTLSIIQWFAPSPATTSPVPINMAPP